jgi:nucleotide-binding universal stress UspA family protein
VYKNILLPTDGTEFCQKAVVHGVELAKLAGAKVTGVTVAVPMRRMIAASLSAELLEDIKKSHRLALEKALGFVATTAKAAGVQFETIEILDDHPYRGIIAAAEKKGCDLIVMASHGQGGLAAVIVGSETHKVVTHTDIPVLIYR